MFQANLEFVSVIEKYLMASDKTKFIDDLQNHSNEKRFLKIFTTSSDKELQQSLKYFNLSPKISSILTLKSLIKSLDEQKNEEIIRYRYEKIAKLLHFNSDFYQSTTANTTFYNQVKVNYQDTLDQNEIRLQTYFDNNIKNSNFLNTLTNYGFVKLTDAQINKLSTFQQYSVYLSRIDLASLDDKIYPLLKKYCQSAQLLLNKNFSIPQHIYRNLSQNQLKKLVAHFPNVLTDQQYFANLFKKSFGQDLYKFNREMDINMTHQQLLKKRQLLKNIIVWLQKFNIHFLKSFVDQLNYEILFINTILEQVDLNLFINFLKKPKEKFKFFNQSYSRQIQSAKVIQNDNSFWYNVHNLRVGEWPRQTKLLNTIFEQLFQKDNKIETLSQFYDYFQEEYVNNIYYKIQLKKGTLNQNPQRYLSKEIIKQLKDSKELTIRNNNKKQFKLGEDILISIRTKNIKEITILVYQINLEKHYLTSGTQIDSQISLNFIEPFKRIQKNINVQSPFKIQDIQINLHQILENKPSVYIVQFQGEGISSRAIIRRGSIICLKRETLSGLELKFYDEQGKTIQELDLWIQKKKVSVKSKYVIPYGINNQNYNIIAVKNQFAQLIPINIRSEKYQFHVNYVYHEENFLVGTKAKVLLQPHLLSYENQVPLQFLKTNQINVKLINHQNIQSAFQISDFQWDPKNEYELQIPIQTYIKNINIVVSTTTLELYSGKSQNFTSSHEIVFRDSQTENTFAELYLTKQIHHGYILKVLGKNGQPKANILVTVYLNSALFNNPVMKTLKTNEKGFIVLGQLKNIKDITAEASLANNQRLTNSWKIQNPKRQVFYQDSYNLIVNEQISLPLTQNFDIQHDVSFLRYITVGDIISNEKKNLQIREGRLIAKFRHHGLYKIFFKHLDQTITINVSEGKYWQTKTQIYNPTEKKLITTKVNPHSSIGINNQLKIIQHENFNEYSLDLNVTQGTSLQTVRAHVIASSFIYQKSGVEAIRQKLNPFRSNQYTFPEKYCEYLSNKELSDQHCYVLARQNQTKFIGNNLQKPRVLLKRTFNRDTSYLEQQLNSQRAYKRQENVFYDQPCMQNMPRYMMAPPPMAMMPMARSMPLIIGNTTNNNFLKNSSIVLANLHGKTLKFKLPKYYQIFTIIVDSPFFAIEKLFSLKQNKIQIQDLRHLKIKQGLVDQGLTMSRQVYRLFAGQNLKVNRNSLWTAISSSQIEVFARTKRFKLWDWILKWNSYNEIKKQEVYNEFCCHELNTYIKFHDPEFFKNTVKPFIENKLQKSVVDYCLLEDEAIQRYACVLNYKQLNPFEKCLLISVLVKLKYHQLAKNITTNIELQEKQKIYSYEEYQNYFDTVMTSQKVQRRQQQHQIQYFSSSSNIQHMNQPVTKCMEMMQHCEYKAYQLNDLIMPRSQVDQYIEPQQQLQERKGFKPGFKQIEKTKEYAQTTYYGITDRRSSANHISASKFWIDLSRHLLQNTTEFISENFMYLNSVSQFALALSFLPKQSSSKFNLSNQGEFINIAAENSFLVFVKEVKSVSYKKKYGILINQRFYDPIDPYTYQSDGTKIQKSVEEFIKDTIYVCQTIVTNTSVANIQSQILIDLPQGSIPISSKEYTKVISQTLRSYQTKSIQVKFYFPQAGQFSVYPANVSKNGVVVAKAEKVKDIIVNDSKKIIKLETFTDILRSGTKSDIVKFIKQKNIFDNTTFNIREILWLLKDREFYQEIIKIFTQRLYFDQTVWGFSVYHRDINSLKKIVDHQVTEFGDTQIFQYYPLSSKRAHKFMDQNKSGILNVEFKNTYNQFLLSNLLLYGLNNIPVKNVIAFAYYLLLQDRIQQAQKILKTIDERVKQKSFPRIQYDYLKSYLDIYTGYPNFTIAREISIKYINYPVIAWRNLFKDVYNLLYTHDNTIFVEQAVKDHQIRIINKGSYLSLLLPEKTTVEINFHAVNLQLFFSQSPFMDVNIFSTVRPFKTQHAYSEKGGQVRIQKPTTYPDIYVQPIEITSDRNPQKLNSFLWMNDDVKVKVVEQSGYAIVYLDGKQKPGAYCKVYAKGSKTRFYRDGYTDIQGRFQYINAQLNDISEFALLFLTEKGGVIKYAKTPNLKGKIEFI